MRNSRNFLRITTAIIMLIICFSVPALGQQRTVRVAFYPLDGFFEYDENGLPYGYGVELLNKISENTGLKFEYVHSDSWEKTRDMLINGEADIRMPVTLPTSPQETFVFTNDSVLDTYHALMTLSSRKEPYYKDYENFSSLRIGVAHSLYSTTNIMYYLDAVGISHDALVFYDEYLDLKTALDNGEIDALISNIMDMGPDMRLLARFNASSNYISALADNDFLQIINEALDDIQMNTPTYLSNLYQQYYPERSVAPLTRVEAEFIENSGVITVGILPNARPFSRYDAKTGEMCGISLDILDWISESSGLEFELIPISEAEKPLSVLKNGEYDMVAGVLDMPDFRSDDSIILSDPFNSAPITFVAKSGYHHNSEKPVTVVITQAFQALENYITENYPHYRIIYRRTEDECFQAVLDGDAEIMLHNIYLLNYYLQKARYSELELYTATLFTENNCFAIRSSSNPVLISIVNRSIDLLSTSRLNEMLLAHTASEPYEYTLSDTIYKYRVQLLITLPLALFAVALLGIILVIRHRNTLRIKAKNEELAIAYENAQVAYNAKSSFLAKMSHEIRTPLNAIIGMTAIASDHVSEPHAIKSDLTKIQLSSKILLTIINDVLDMSAIESGKMKISSSEFDFKQLITSLSAIYYTQCRFKDINFSVMLTAPVNEHLIGDQLRVNQILMNLLNNAVKFTDKGFIRLDISPKPSADDNQTIVFTVSDSGCGIDSKLLDRIWEPFEQESAETAHSHGGSGLGLSIVHNLVELMGGKITVNSEKGKGSSFTFELTFGIGKALEVPQDVKQMRTLIIDDAQDTRRYTSRLMEELRIPFSAITSGGVIVSDTLDHARNEGKPFDVCILEWKTPHITSIETINLIKNLPPEQRPKIIITAYDDSELHELAKSASIDAVMLRPLFGSALVEALASLLREVVVKSKAKSAPDLNKRRVLVADDNALNRTVSTGLLKKAGIVCETAENGQIAYEMFITSNHGYYDAILMDVQMPECNGYEATRRIRACEHPDAKTVPIIAMTANAFSDDIAAAHSSGMNYHISKPINYDILISTLIEALDMN